MLCDYNYRLLASIGGRVVKSLVRVGRYIGRSIVGLRLPFCQTIIIIIPYVIHAHLFQRVLFRCFARILLRISRHGASPCSPVRSRDSAFSFFSYHRQLPCPYALTDAPDPNPSQANRIICKSAKRISALENGHRCFYQVIRVGNGNRLTPGLPANIYRHAKWCTYIAAVRQSSPAVAMPLV